MHMYWMQLFCTMLASDPLDGRAQKNITPKANLIKILIMSMLRMLLATLAIGSLAQTNNLLDQFVATFTGGDTTRAKELVTLLEGCSASSSTNLLQQVFSDSLNATRVCWTLEAPNKANAKKCVERATSAFQLATSPYDLFSAQVLTDAEQAKLTTCAAGVNTNQIVEESFVVLSKRFLQCDFSGMTPNQRTAILDVFGDDAESSEPTQVQDTSRAQMSSLCTSLDYLGAAHRDAVTYVTQMLKHMTQLLPNRR